MVPITRSAKGFCHGERGVARTSARPMAFTRCRNCPPKMPSRSRMRNRGDVEVRVRHRVVDGRGQYRLETVVLEDTRTGRREEVAVAAIFVLIGAEPRTDWLRDTLQRDGSGFVLTGRDVSLDGWTLDRPPMLLETSVPGVFAVGDVRHGSVKRVNAAVGDGSVAVGSVHAYLAEAAARMAGRA